MELNQAVNAEATATATAVETSKGRPSLAVAREGMTAEIARQWLEVRTDVFTPEEHGVDERIEQKNLYWLKPVLGRPAGSFAGQRRPVDDYYSVTLLGNSYSGSRLIALIETGEWPAERVREGVVKARTPLAVRTAPAPLTNAQRVAMREQAKAAALAKKAGKTVEAPKAEEPKAEPGTDVETLTAL